MCNMQVIGGQVEKTVFDPNNKLERVFPIVIWSEFRMRQYRDDNHRKEVFDLRYDLC